MKYIYNEYGFTEEEWNAMNWCEQRVQEYKYKRRNGIEVDEDLYEAYSYAQNVLDSIEAERRYLDGEDR